MLLIEGFENPRLPPLCDPELFDNIFLQNLYSGQSNFMRRYGDSLLRTMTYDIFGELLGRQSNTNLFGTMDFAVSNAFYEKILQHYNLESLSIDQGSVHNKSAKKITIQRGDVLEAYMAGVETDISRCGDGYREIHTWLYKIMALRLGKGGAGASVPPVSRRPALSFRDSIDVEFEGSDEVRKSKVYAVNKVLDERISARNIWWDPKTQPPNGTIRTDIQRPLPAVRERQSDEQIQLNQFRQSLFDEMCNILREVQRTIRNPYKTQCTAFWMVFKCYLGGLQNISHPEEIQVLIHYYRVHSVVFLLI
jgi:hypothetical protein